MSNPYVLDYVTYTLIVDDIVHADGRTAMEQLGGGGPQTAFGIRLWAPKNARVGLAGGIGSDLPNLCRTWLDSFCIETEGLLVYPFPTLRAWQLFEEDGRRTQVWRVPLKDEIWKMLRPSVTSLPISFQRSSAYHVGVHPSGRDVTFLRELRATGTKVLSVEPYTRAEEIVPRLELIALLTSAHIFSPNEEEAWSMVGPGSPRDVIGRLVELGGEIVCLRRGPQGAVIHRAETGETWEIPAFYSIFGEKDKQESTTAVPEKDKKLFEPQKTKRGTPKSDFEPLQGLPEDENKSILSLVTGFESDSVLKIESKPKQEFGEGEGKLEIKEHGIKETNGMRVEEIGEMGGDDEREEGEGEGEVRLQGVKDQTGCGNSFCGGFLAGWVTHGDLKLAGLWGSVAASFMIEYEGVPLPSSKRREEARLRMAMLEPFAQLLERGEGSGGRKSGPNEG